MRQFFIETFGCQMNERDSEIMEQLLTDKSCSQTYDLNAADLIIVNTCSIRGKAEQKAYSLLGRLRSLKEKKKNLMIVVSGCVAQQDGPGILKRMPHVDLVIGPQNIYRLPELIDAPTDVSTKRKSTFKIATALSPTFQIPPFLPKIKNKDSSYKRFVTIMQGCNNFCTYCVVPFTRGREISRSADDIMNEVHHLVQQGIREVTLLGQNVNSYRLDQQQAAASAFPQLLRSVAAIENLERIRFTTSHPKDLSDDLMRCFSELDKLCPHFHLPVQSGSNSVLKRMNRKYTIENYLEKVMQLRDYNKEIALTTDIIVGFPGETDNDFQDTMNVIETVRYHSAYSFKYSDRPNAQAAKFDNKVPEEVKSERLRILQKRQDEISLERNKEYIGRKLQVMIEGESKDGDGQWCGRSITNHIVNFSSPGGFSPGQLVDVDITAACQNSLRGEMAQ
ncbi:tRNA (N6-isopentenyl adenosine(37)-C2)-methylthiotransferase MiaB [Thermodesulfobacteriota bacterium]